MNEYRIMGMNDWSDVGADLAIADPPFGIDFDGKASNYNREESNVVEGYIEWVWDQYQDNINKLLDTLHSNLEEKGQALIFSGWNNSDMIRNSIESRKDQFSLRGKLYWVYNFAPYCKKRPAHNIYEIYWLTKGDEWYYTNECSFDHCQDGEPNLTSIYVKKDYKKDMPKYPTRLPLKLLRVLLEHFSREEDTVFDPLTGSGMTGIASEIDDREWLIGDLNRRGKEVFEELKEYYDI